MSLTLTEVPMEEEEAKFIRQYNPPLNKTTVTDEGKHVIKTRKMA